MTYSSFTYDPVTEEIQVHNAPCVARDWIKEHKSKWAIIHDTDSRKVYVYEAVTSNHHKLTGNLNAIWVNRKATPKIKAHALLFGL